MELFKNTNFDFLGKKWPFIIASLVLSVAGLASLALKGGPRYGIDFKGGTPMTVKFAGKPPIDEIRAALSKRVTGEVTVQTFEAGSNEVAIGTELQDERQLDQNRRAMLDTLTATFGQPASGKLDFNNAGQDALASRLRDAAGKQQRGHVRCRSCRNWWPISCNFRNTPPRSGLITSFDQLSGGAGRDAAVINTLKQECYLAPFSRARGGGGGTQGGRRSAAAGDPGDAFRAGRNAGIYSVSLRVDLWRGGGDRVLPRHDHHDRVVLPVQQGDHLTVIAALLTLVGYSMNDTIVIFDRIRENLKLSRREPLE